MPAICPPSLCLGFSSLHYCRDCHAASFLRARNEPGTGRVTSARRCGTWLAQRQSQNHGQQICGNWYSREVQQTIKAAWHSVKIKEVLLFRELRKVMNFFRTPTHGAVPIVKCIPAPLVDHLSIAAPAHENCACFVSYNVIYKRVVDTSEWSIWYLLRFLAFNTLTISKTTKYFSF